LTTTSTNPDAAARPRRGAQPVPEIHRKSIIVDGHCDTPYRLKRLGLRLSDPSPEAQVNLELLKQSGITGSFFVSYVPPFYAERGAAAFCRGQIELIQTEVAAHPEDLTFVTDSQGIREAKEEGSIAILIGIEGGHAIEDSLEILEEFYDRGARYLTLTHVNTNNWCDASTDEARHGGLNDLGRQVVRTMNDLGMIVDISHVSDQAFYHALETSRAPIIASHSSCRALTLHPRNMTDAMLRDLASRDGVCMINFYTAFVNDSVAARLMAAQKRVPNPNLQSRGEFEELPDDRLDWEGFVRWYRSLELPPSTIDDVVAHIVHATEVAGVNHVGIGSDFDGVPALPEGLTDASRLPALTEKLIDRGFADEEIERILGLNFLRVFEAVEAAAR
jgi:membrane dipeptidase